MSTAAHGPLLGRIAADATPGVNERARVRIPYDLRDRVRRNQYVTIADARSPGLVFLGRLITGPFFPSPEESSDIVADVEIQGELDGNQTYDTNNRPAPESAVYELGPAEVRELLGLHGDMVLGCLSGWPEIGLSLQSHNKDVLPRNVGIFGTVGSGKSNSVQVIIEEASARGWAIVLLDLEAEYVYMDQPTSQETLARALPKFGREPRGLPDFHVYHPVSCTSDRPESQPFTLRIADFEPSVTAELLQCTLAERNALFDCIDYLQQKYQPRMTTTDSERLTELFDPAPAKPPYTLQLLKARATERSPRNSESMDYVGLASKLQQLVHSGAFDQPNMRGLDPAEMLQPGRVNVIDVSIANDNVKNLVTADLLRKAFAYKIAREKAPPTLLVIEEAHSFMSRERAHTMHATLQMLRNVTRRGRKRWLALAFVSQQPGHLPPEIFELCNTRIVHTLRSMHNLDALMATTGDITRELWSRCPLLGTGEAIISSPQFHRAVVARIRPAASNRRFTR
ncbi:MAG: ATP-binding protein [Gemmataceae bacterium]|nr:ATP-binding protein [Gemmataceae bacterium]MDW8266948.1 ATP-binding protein [Gemmataceae bacterium]